MRQNDLIVQGRDDPVSKLSLRQVMILGVGLGIFLPVLFLAPWFVHNRYHQELELRIHAPLAQYADMLSHAMSGPLWNVDAPSALPLVNAILSNPDVVSISVDDQALGHFVYSEHPERRIGGNVQARRDVMHNDKVIGQVRIELTTSRIEAQLLEDALRFAFAVFAQIVFSFVFILLLFERRMMAPLRQLLKGAARLARGELDQPVVWQRADELGVLAKGLDDMREKLGGLFSERQIQNLALQRELAERQRVEDELRVSQAKFAVIFQSSPVPILVARASEDYAKVDVNDAWLRQFHWSHDDAGVQAAQWRALWQVPDERQEVMTRIEQHNEVHDHEAMLHRADEDDYRLCSISGRKIEIVGDALLILAVEDITEKRRNELEVRMLNARLEDRVAERTQALQKANDELNETLQTLQRAQGELLRSEKLAALGSLVAGVAHELNTPIGIGVTVASTLQEDSLAFARAANEGLSRSRLNQFVDKTRTASDLLMRSLGRAAELISSFKQVAVDQTSAQRRVFKLAELVHEIVLTLGPSIRKTPYTVGSDIPLDIVLDSFPGHLGQVLINLVNNALVHAFEGKGEGHVLIAAQAIDAEHIRITVSDDGKGIAEQDLPRIFDPFFTTRLGQGGSGLGLNIVHNLVSGPLRGSISVSSTPTVGTTFTLQLQRVGQETSDCSL